MKKKNKFYEILKENWLIFLIIIVSLILHILTTIELGFKYSLNSDDASYIQSGVIFLKTGQITMHGVLSAQIMPGMTYLIAIVALIFGTGTKLVVSLKIFWMLMGITTIYIVYKIIRLYANNKYIAALPCIFFLAADYIWMDNIILTETPFILLFALLFYHGLRLSKTSNKKDYVLTVTYYIIAVFIRPNIGIFPIFLFIYLVLKKYDFKLLIKQFLIAGLIVILILMPWIYRNYKLFNKFIPLTYGVGNPLLLGTYQGVGYPSDEQLDYITNVDEKMSDEMRYYIENLDSKEYLRRYYFLEYDGMKAKYRMKYWWNHDKKSMIKSYLFYKPKEIFYNYFYWDNILKVDSKCLVLLRKIEICLFIFSTIFIFIDKKRVKEWLFLMMMYGSQIALYSYTFAFSRYAITMFFIRYIIIGLGLDTLYNLCKKWRKRK